MRFFANTSHAVIEKKVGETPLQALQYFRADAHIPADVPLAYAGRLDPLASGKLLVLIGDECKRQEKYHSLDKEYEVEVLLSFSSDTGDVLGIADYAGVASVPSRERAKNALTGLCGTRDVPYPHFSSKTVDGKPLFLWTLEGRLDEITVPTTAMITHQLTLLSVESISKGTLEKRVSTLIESIPEVTDPGKKLGDDFRRPSIRARWKELFAEIPEDTSFPILRIRVTAGAGTYMRTLAGEIGHALGTKALALSIHRTKIGRYVHLRLPFIPIGFWAKSY